MRPQNVRRGLAGLGNFICWELHVGWWWWWWGIRGPSEAAAWEAGRCFDEGGIPGASHNRRLRLCHPCHSPGFISRKSAGGRCGVVGGWVAAFLLSAALIADWGRREDKEGHSHRRDAIGRRAASDSHASSEGINLWKISTLKRTT